MKLTDQNYVDIADKVMDSLMNSSSRTKLTTSKIRKLLSLTSALYDEARMKPFEELAQKLSYLRVQIVYQAGRERTVKDFVKEAKLLEYLGDVRDTQSLLRFCRYMEALVAYFKYYGGKEN